MKNKKLTLSILKKVLILSIILITMLIQNTAIFADTPPAVKGVFDKLTDCITKSEDENELNKIYTIIEEPFSMKPFKSEDEKTGYKICYRHSMTITKWEAGKIDNRLPSAYKLAIEECGHENLSSTILNNDKKEGDEKIYSCTEVGVLYTDSKEGTNLIYLYIGMIYRWSASVVGIIAVLVIMISAIQLSLAGGEPEAVSSAKRRIIQSLAGIAILFLSGLILYTVNPTFFVR